MFELGFDEAGDRTVVPTNSILVPGLIYSSLASGSILYFRLYPLCEGWKDSETPPAHAKLRVCAPHATVPLRLFAQAGLIR